ncbi:hypothetical protein [Kibdelosporangium aridum]|uniref:Uncharacterized protein n=1 Tax=Kibdelosporangium aridum TaxID=2030 RepID=A0A1W2FYW4_KIBAR|nr:hypothetical protein [Kibdelosporangium aridum]SMD26974.1 hypothetical protein SAMN05661093_10561 [Kibdelosporangium aridum]
MDGRPDDATQILLAEYAALRAEAERRATVQWHVVALHPTRLAFQGVAVLALVGALGAGIFLWITRSPSWYVIAGFAVGWLIDTLATVFLHRSIVRLTTAFIASREPTGTLRAVAASSGHDHCRKGRR